MQVKYLHAAFDHLASVQLRSRKYNGFPLSTCMDSTLVLWNGNLENYKASQDLPIHCNKI
jgi:hypothetical protein